MKYCPNCGKFQKVKTRYTLPDQDNVYRQIACLTCKDVYYTQEAEIDKTTFLLARKNQRNV